MKNKRNKTNRRGAALLVVLFIVMAATILSLGFLSRSDVELACGENMILRTQMDYLAESGLEHAKGLILNPQDVNSEYWRGAEGLQMVEGSNDYYDVTVSRDDLNLCNYIITCDAYREKNGERIGRSSLKAELRLDPCIALWSGVGWISEQQTTVNGDVYCAGSLGGEGQINGDAYASSAISGASITGRTNETVSEAPVDWPGLEISYFYPNYYIVSSLFSADEIFDSNVHPAGSFGPSEANPVGIRYYSDDVNLPGNVNINGMLMVKGDLKISGANNTITAVKNFPALLVTGELLIEDGGRLVVNGLAQLKRGLQFSSGAENAHINVSGGLFLIEDDIDGLNPAANPVTNSVEITAAPAIAAIEIWPTPGNPVRWSPAAGAFFRSIERN